MESQMEELLKLLKSNELANRKKAIDALAEWNYALDLEDCLTLLKEAAKIKPISDEDWDNPSEALVRAACLFIHEDMLLVIEENIYHYSLGATLRVLSFLLMLGTEASIALYKKVFSNVCLRAQLDPYDEERWELLERKMGLIAAVEALLENNVHFHPWYIDYYHFLLYGGIKNGYFANDFAVIDKDYLVLKLKEQTEAYLEYDKAYNAKYVYEAWRNRYYYLRWYFKCYLTLFDSISNDEELLQYKDILNWKDPNIKLHYIELLLKRNIEVDNETILSIFHANENATEAFDVIYKINPDLLPKEPDIQNCYVQEMARYYFYNTSGVEKLPDAVEVMGSFEDANFYGESLTYYVARFRSLDPSYADDGWMRIFVGPFLTAELPTAYLPVDQYDTHSDYLPWEKKSMEEHIADFRELLNKKYNKDSQNEAVYVYTPSFNRQTTSIAVVLFFLSFGLLWVNDWFVLGLVIVPLWWLLTFIHAKRLEKNVAIQLRKYHMDYYCFNDGHYLELYRIASITLEKRLVSLKERFLFLPIKKWHFVFKGDDGEEFFVIPRDYLKDGYFFSFLKQQTEHLYRKPVLTWEQEAS